MAKAKRKPLTGCYVISLRPVGAHAPLRHAAAAQGAKALALSPWRIEAQTDAATRSALRAALATDFVIATSPAAVRAASALHGLKRKRGQHWCAVGAGTAAALRRAGIDEVHSPGQMDSDGLLGLPLLQSLRGHSVGLLTAPGGRGVIAPELQRRGARVLRADVYRRVTVAPSPLAQSRLRRMQSPLWIAVSSGEALQRSLQQLPAELSAKLLAANVSAASARLAQLSRALGFHGRIVVAASARPRDLVAAMHASSDGKPPVRAR